MSAFAFLALASFTFLGISSSYWYTEQRIPNRDHIKWSDDKKTFTVFPANGTSNSSTWKVKKSCKVVNGHLACNSDGKSGNKTLNAQDVRRRRAAEKQDLEIWNYFAADASSSCFVPELDTAEIRCTIRPTYITCNSYCIYGYTYEEGIVRTLNCTYSKNRWKPYFEECAPFIDCSVKLVSPGFVKCLETKVMESPTCEMECDIYEDKDPVPKQTYKCKTDGTWDPFMPFCVQPKGLKKLVNPPGQVEHKEFKHP